MKFWPAWLVFAILSILAKGQHSEVSKLLDSVMSVWYSDFDRTQQLVSKAEKFFTDSLATGKSELIELYKLRIQSCLAFSRLLQMNQYIHELENFLQKNEQHFSGAVLNRINLELEFSKAQYHLEIGEFEKALKAFLHIKSELMKLPRTSQVCFDIYLQSNYIAGILRQAGEFEASVNEYLSGIPYLVCSKRQGFPVFYRNLGLTYLEKHDFNQAGNYLKLAEDSLRRALRLQPEEHARVAISLYETQASYYERIGQPDSAMLAMRKALSLIHLRSVNNLFKGRIYYRLGGLNLRIGKLSEANKYIGLAETNFGTLEGDRLHLARTYLLKAEWLSKSGDYTKALEYCAKAEMELAARNESDVNGNQMTVGTVPKKELFNILQTKSHLLERFFERTADQAYLINALNTNQLSLALLDSTANEFSLDKDKIILSELSYSAFEDGIRIANRLYSVTGDKQYQEKCFWLIDKSKGILLLENLRLVNRFSGIEPEWLQREKELKAEMLWVEQEIFKTESAENQSDKLQSLRERYATLKRDYGVLVNRFKSEASAYYKLRFDHSVVSSETIQKQLLKRDEGLVQFFVGDSILAVAGFTPTRKYLNVKPLPPDFTDRVNQLRFALTRSSDATFNRSAGELYDFLLKDCLAEIGKDVRSLTIIPDGLLGYIPFEVLRPSPDDTQYLNDYMAIHYAHSATYLSEQRQRKPGESKYFFAGFVVSGSPEQGVQQAARDRELAVLKGAEREVASITELIRAKFSVFNPAGKTDFITHAPDYQVLHLAMHSVVNDMNPMMSEMIFTGADSSSRSLTAGELYGMQLNSQLAVLSACNTGMGQLHRGEGIMSFSRAFAYAGVPAAVISLWKVPDEATSKIMVGFYRNLKNGKPKDRALQLARQEFVRDNPEYAHPYFWSGFILTGTANPIEFPSAFQWYWFIAGLLVILAFGFALRKRLMPGRFLSGSS